MSHASLSDAALATEVAALAGKRLLEVRASTPRESLGAAGDRESEALIARLIREARPDDGYFSEECAPDPARLQKHRVWIIDPLDGTREFAESDRSDWAVHVALAIDGRPDACAVALPASGFTFSTTNPPVLPAATTGQVRIVVSRTRAPSLTEKVATELGATLVPMGSAGAKAMAVVRGQAEAYLHAGGMYEWDTCAPVGVALAAGLHASRIDGSPCLYNRADAAMPDLLICRKELAEAMLSAIRHTIRGTPV